MQRCFHVIHFSVEHSLWGIGLSALYCRQQWDLIVCIKHTLASLIGPTCPFLKHTQCSSGHVVVLCGSYECYKSSVSGFSEPEYF